MKELRDRIKWEDAILTAVEQSGGFATLKELYQTVPQIREIPSHLDANHIIRAFLRRMTRISGKLKRVGLGVYALPGIKLDNSLYSEIQKGKDKKRIFEGINDDPHTYIEGMLLELGNIYGYLTYTADPSRVFSGKTLEKFATVEQFPAFTSTTLMNVAKAIDVIWFKKRALVIMPKHTFDVEKTTDFSNALHRAYQLRDFKTSFYMVSTIEKTEQFKRKLATDPYQEISDRCFFRSFEEIFVLYELAVKHSELKEEVIVEA